MKWETKRSEHALITAIADRALRMAAEARPVWKGLPSRGEFSMDITACHLNDVKLELADLLDADDSDFSHDVFGIRRNLDRQTGELQNCFLPRFNVREEA